MSQHVSHLLEIFDTLSEPDKRSAVVEILRRSPPGEPDIASLAHDALAAELFAALDEEEAARASGR